MKRPLRFLCVIAVLLAALACLTCGEGIAVYVVGTEADMSGLSVKSVRINAAPAAISDLDFDDEEFDINSAPFVVGPLERKSDSENARFYPSVSKGARVVWGIGTQDMRPFVFNDLRIPANFDDGDYVYFKVTSEDGDITNYYRYLMWVRSPVVELSDVYIGKYETEPGPPDAQGNPTTVVKTDERMMAVLATPTPNLQAAMAASAGTLDIMTKQKDNAEIKAVPYDATATLRYARTRSVQETPVFGTNNTFTLDDQDILFIEVTAQNTVDKAYYKLLVTVGRINTIKTLTLIGAGGVEFAVSNKGTPQSAYGRAVAGKFETADMPPEGFGVEIELDDPAGSYEFLGYEVSGTNPQFTGTTGGPAKIVFNGTNRLVVRVISEKNMVFKFYKIDVVLLAGTFTAQPKSDYYYHYNSALKVGSADKGDQVSWYVYAAKNFKDSAGVTLSDSVIQSNVTSRSKSTPAQLTAELDRNVTGTYQWYEANSWYGGYGFDADGKILYYPPGSPDAEKEDGFTADKYHIDGFDEKKNVSFHNGGNQYYRLENPGRPISGASGNLTATKTIPGYTPTIADKRPFIDGFTNETHYYWVVVTDTTTTPPRQAISKRAAIVTERDGRKDHYIINLNEDLKPEIKDGEVIWPGTARNQKVFTKKREVYKIPVTIPTSFNIDKFTVVTVQALFFLKDGTPWIQNWTQGDVGFEDVDEKTVMYYNLTNNNGTLALVGGGKEPNGGTVEGTPKYLIVKPAGEKPINTLPPFEADGVTPKPNNDAQGWFCGFIELVEVRFEGPAR
jgi:hypothetical protein